MAIKCPKCQAENPETVKFCGECGTKFLSLKATHPDITETLQTPIKELATGFTFAGRYQVIEELGKGGMGRVYKVFDTDIKEKIALKLLRPEIASDRETIERFSNELKYARKISHRNVCRMYDLGKAEGTYFITMEYVSGEDLKTMIRMSCGLAVGTMLSIGKQVCEGLAEAHSLGVVHRDLKPQNIMIDKGGNTKILDFGIARSIKEKGITGPSVLIGTPEYLSPEQAEAKDVDQRSDIYSLGIILYEMATGRVPFEGDTALSIAMRHKGEIPKNPKQFNPNIPDDLSAVILKCLEKDKAKRYQTAAEVQAELGNIEKGIPVTERLVPERKTLTSKRITVQFELRRLMIPAIILVAVVLLGIVIWKFLPRKGVALAPKIKNSIAVISFENLTGDKAFDDLQKAIPNLLITSLERTGELYIVTWERMADLLSQMGEKDVKIIDRDLGFQLCRREGVEAIVLGSFVKLGNIFAIDVKVLDVGTKRPLKSATSKGEGADSILRTQIDELSREIIAGIGLARKKMEAGGEQVTEVTTSSMEAYEYYLKGKEDYYKFYYEDARKSLAKAIELDAEFASAYAYLALVHHARGSIQARNDAIKKAQSISVKTTERERLYIESFYAYLIERDQDKRISILKEITKKYPREKTAHYYLGAAYRIGKNYELAVAEHTNALELDPNFGDSHNDLGYLYLELRDFEKAIDHFQKYAALNPKDGNPIDALGDAYYEMGQLDQAIAKYKEALSIKPDLWFSQSKFANIYALKEEPAAALEWIDKFIAQAPTTGLKGEGYAFKGFYQSWLGSFRKGLENLDKAEGLLTSVGNEAGKASVSWVKSFISLSRGELDPARKFAKEWFDVFMSEFPENQAFYNEGYLISLGYIDLKGSIIGSARTRSSEAMSLVPALTPSQKDWGAFIAGLFRAEVLLAEGAPEGAIAVYEKMIMPRGTGTSGIVSLPVYNTPFFKDIIARAYLQKGDLDRAITEYEKLIAFDPNSRARFLVHPELHYRLGKLYEQKGLKAKAAAQYQKFLELWKDTDPGQPEVEDARTRLAELKGA